MIRFEHHASRPLRSGALALLAAGLLFAGTAIAQEGVTAPTETGPAATQTPSTPPASSRLPTNEAQPAPSPATEEPVAPNAAAAPSVPADAPTGQVEAAPPASEAAGDAPATAPSPTPDAAAPQPADASSMETSEPPAAAPAAPTTEASAGTAALPHDLSPWGMFMAADYVVKAVMIGLAFASLVTWTIWLAKALELAVARAKAARGVRQLERAESLGEVAGTGGKWPKRGPVAALVAAAEIEIERSGQLSPEGVKERTQVALQRIEARAGRAMARGTGLLATIGSTAPFVGLFGTVWGIMNSFIGISQANTTNLAVVAPGIAEALLATAIGLVAAIPAVIIYNVFSRSIAGYRAILADASAEVLRHVSRDLDRREFRARGRTAGGGRLEAAE